MGALLGDDVVEAGPGDLVHKPRNQWHTFWNAGDEPCRILEIISPAGFEHFFRELDEMGGAIGADPEALAQLNGRYGLEMRPGRCRSCSSASTAHWRALAEAGGCGPAATPGAAAARRRSRVIVANPPTRAGVRSGAGDDKAGEPVRR
jgi:hypothetical protein